MSNVIRTTAWDDQALAKNVSAVLAVLETIDKGRVEALTIETAVERRHWADFNAEPSTYPGMTVVPDSFRVSAWLKPEDGHSALDIFDRTSVIATYCGRENVLLAAGSMAEYFGGVPVWDWTETTTAQSARDGDDRE